MSQKPLTYFSQIVKTPFNVGAVGDAAVFLAPSELGGSPRPLEGGEQHWAKYAKRKYVSGPLIGPKLRCCSLGTPLTEDVKICPGRNPQIQQNPLLEQLLRSRKIGPKPQYFPWWGLQDAED